MKLKLSRNLWINLVWTYEPGADSSLAVLLRVQLVERRQQTVRRHLMTGQRQTLSTEAAVVVESETGRWRCSRSLMTGRQQRLTLNGLKASWVAAPDQGSRCPAGGATRRGSSLRLLKPLGPHGPLVFPTEGDMKLQIASFYSWANITYNCSSTSSCVTHVLLFLEHQEEERVGEVACVEARRVGGVEQLHRRFEKVFR